MDDEELRPEDIDFYAQQTLKHWEEVGGGGKTRYREKDTDSYIVIDHDSRSIEGKLQGALGEAGEELDTLAGLLEEEGYERGYVDNEVEA